MEKGLGSGGVVKKKSSSGCLIIKKKGDAMRGVGSSSELYREKKRSRMVLSDLGSSDESLDLIRQKGDKFHNDLALNPSNVVLRRSYFGRNGELESSRKRRRFDLYDFDGYDAFDGQEMRNDYITEQSETRREFRGGCSIKDIVYKRRHLNYNNANDIPGGKDNRIESFDYDHKSDTEDDEPHLPISSLREKFQQISDEPIRLQGKNGVLKVMVNKKNKLALSHKSYGYQEAEARNNLRSDNLVKRTVLAQHSLPSDVERLGKPFSYVNSEETEPKPRNSLPTKSSKAADMDTGGTDTSLKLELESMSGQESGSMKRLGKPVSYVKQEKTEWKRRKAFPTKSSKAADMETDGTDTSLKFELGSTSGQESGSVKRLGKPVFHGKLEETEPRRRNSLPTKCNKSAEKETGGTDKSLKLELGPTSGQESGSVNRVKNEGKSPPPTENIKLIRGKEGKVERGSGTEKQLLREQIRTMLVNAGWTIDYRPRRNRDYLDAVYINTSGTAYWSIIKAYDAFQKQLDEKDSSKKSGKGSSQFIPLSEEILSKLTRRTRKKMEKEMKKKRGRLSEEAAVRLSEECAGNDQHDQKLSFHPKQNGKLQRGRSNNAGHLIGDDSTDKSNNEMPRRESNEECDTTNTHVIQERKSRQIVRCTLLVRNSGKGQNPDSGGFVPYTGRRTLLAWLIDSGTVQLSEKVQYMNRRRTKVLLEGWITRDGIHCGCCSKILTVSKFELHAGTKQRQPFQNIFLESGNSLLQCQIDAWNRQEESERLSFHSIDVDDPNDDTCGICGDGGDLICCDGCPSTFHQSCLGIQMLPAGDWHCPNCACKFCGSAFMNTAEQTRNVSSLQICSLCEKKYHRSCRSEMDGLSADSTNSSASFCGKSCQELFECLQKLIGVKHEFEAGFSWSLIRRTDPELDVLHCCFPPRVECNSKLAVALSIMDECFLPIIDRRSGINLLHNVLYNCGSNFSRLNFGGFYTVVLERGDELISAASIRIHGIQLAEMPFIGTRHIYRRQGMCRRLLCAIESVLCSLKVEKLIIPAIAEHMHTWTAAFGFHLLEESDKQETRSMNMLVFPGTDMLQKLLVKDKNYEGNTAPNSGVKSVDSNDKYISLHDSSEKLDLESSLGHDHCMDDDTGFCHGNDLNEKVTPVESGSESPPLPSTDGTVVSNSLDEPHESELQFYNKGTIFTKSQSFSKFAECSNSALLACGASDLVFEVENHVTDSVPTYNIQPNAGFIGDAHEANIRPLDDHSVPDTLEGTSTTDIIEVANGDQKAVFRPTVDITNESAMQSNIHLNDQNQIDLQVVLKASSKVEDIPVTSNIEFSVEGSENDGHGANAKVVTTFPTSQISAGSSPERVTENTASDVVQLNSELKQSSTLAMDNKVNASMELFPAIEVATDVKVDDYAQSFAVGAL